MGIVPGAGATSKGAVYSDGLQGFARANPQFCVMVEKNFEEFVIPLLLVDNWRTNMAVIRFLKTDRRTHLLPHMSEVKRKFVVEVCQDKSYIL